MLDDKDLMGKNSKMSRNSKIALVAVMGAAALVAGYQLYKKNSPPKKSEHISTKSTKQRKSDAPSTPSLPISSTNKEESNDSKTKE